MEIIRDSIFVKIGKAARDVMYLEKLMDRS
jgi:hypothetical protein